MAEERWSVAVAEQEASDPASRVNHTIVTRERTV